MRGRKAADSKEARSLGDLNFERTMHHNSTDQIAGSRYSGSIHDAALQQASQQHRIDF
jgi:hypothetical protein